jgi:hypothetical protein
MSKAVLSFLLLLCAAGFGQNLLTNGDFEQEFTVGWDTLSEGSGTREYTRDTGYQSDPDYEACVYQYDNPGSGRLSQTVAVSAPMLEVSFWGRFEEDGGSSTCWPAACFCVSYLDASGVKLGETRYYYGMYVNWVSDDTLHLIQITNPDWTGYTLDVMSELTQNLAHINPADVAQLQVAAWATTTGG